MTEAHRLPNLKPATEPGARAEERLELIPRTVRDTLDRIGIKLHLRQWQALSLVERERLRDLPCASVAELRRYASEVEQLVLRLTGKPAERLKP
jgi:hypothetical protein